MTGANGTGCVVGVDGGNSKTDAAIADLAGNVLARVRGAGTHMSPVHGPARLAQQLAGLVGVAKSKAGWSGTLDAGVFYLANVDLPDEQAMLSAELVKVGVAKEITVDNDTLAVLHAGTDDKWGVAVVLGTGINAIGVGPDGQTERFLGLGSISGDWGGGHGLAVYGVGAAVRFEDGRGDPTVLADTLPAHFGIANAHELALAEDRDEVSLAQVLELTALVIAAADGGDPVAASLVVRQGREVVAMVRALLRRLGRLDVATPVILGGGVGQCGSPLLMATIRQGLSEVAPLAELSVLTAPPVAGAVAVALRQAGAGDDALKVLRAHSW